MSSIGGYHPYGLASILTELETNRACDMLDGRIAARQPPPTFLLALRRALLDEWGNIPQDQIDNLILSIPRRYKPKTHHPDEEPKPRLPDSIARPITNMPLSRMENTTFAMPSIIDSHDMGLRTVFTVQTPKRKRLFNAYSTLRLSLTVTGNA
ncbi:uncharacterized protein TNCV_4572671 [Trichonephila clavipes]|nr:uncharacterized protein TNCV_4572671 [Trichonephila clavipes]